jgi:enhancer of polycomb-like protein
LQQVLNAANNSANNPQRGQRPSTADAATQASAATLQPPQEAHFIPTPDAQGVVANYDDIYSSNSHEMPYAILMFSDTVEECRNYGLAGRSYTMDERDAAWLEKWNKQARGEGTSYSTTRRSRNKANEAEEEPQPVISEDWFELCMGMFEKYASEHFPFLHVVRCYLL